MFSDGDVQGIETDGIGRNARLPVFQIDDGLGERLPALRVPDIAGKDGLPTLGLRQNAE
jgi:hypothetical protein